MFLHITNHATYLRQVQTYEFTVDAYVFEDKIIDSIVDSNGNYVIAKIQIENEKLTIVNINGPNKDTSTSYSYLFRLLELDSSTIICGGWNLTLDPQIHTENYNRINSQQKREIVLRTISENNLCDPW